MIQQEYVKIRATDHDGTTVDHLPVGDGVIDWAEFFRLLKVMNYDGYLGLDLGRKDLEKNLVRSKEFIYRVAGAAGHQVEG